MSEEDRGRDQKRLKTAGRNWRRAIDWADKAYTTVHSSEGKKKTVVGTTHHHHGGNGHRPAGNEARENGLESDHSSTKEKKNRTSNAPANAQKKGNLKRPAHLHKKKKKGQGGGRGAEQKEWG